MSNEIDKATLISGAWYEKQYSSPGERYHAMYVNQEHPAWACAADKHHAAVAAAWLGLNHEDYRWPTRVLDLGSGLGFYVDAWEKLGYEARGVEISAAAVELAWKRRFEDGDRDLCDATIQQGSLVDLSQLEKHVRQRDTLQREQRNASKGFLFALAFSASVLEHVDRSITAQALRETMRLARYGAHYIPLDAGDDPSHIHIQSEREWLLEMHAALGDGFVVAAVPNYACPGIPLYLIARAGDVPWAMGELARR